MWFDLLRDHFERGRIINAPWDGVKENGVDKAELGTSLFEIAQSLFALEQTAILRAMALKKKKREER